MKINLVRLKFSILILIISLNGCANSESQSGYWTGSIKMNRKSIDLSIVLNSEKQIFSIYDLMIIEQPIRNLKIDNEIITFSIVLEVELAFKGVLKNNKINGTVEMQGGPPNMNMTFNLAKQPNYPIKSYSIESLSVRNKDVLLSADIYKPHTESLHPAIVLLHGSTSNDKTDYIFYAEYFANLGFEVLIFDKRGSGKSTGAYYISSYDDLIADAIACLETMYTRESVNKEKIGLWGLSQGALLLPKIASKTNIPKFLISISPDVNSVTEAAAYSDSLRVVGSGNSKSNGHIVAESHRIVEQMIIDGNDYKAVEEFVHQNAQKYIFMNQTGLHDRISINESEFNGFYWKGRTENFQPYWKDLNIPTLVIYGDRDRYVDAERNLSILKRLNNDIIDMKLFPKANHVLKKSFDPSIDTEFDFPRIIEGYTNYVENWISNEIEK